jgi:hypothetical protein
MTKVEITLINTSPKAIMRTQVGNFTSVAEYETVLTLPRCFSSMRVKRMSIGASYSNIILIKLFSFLALLKFPTFFSQKLNTIMLLCLIVI